MLSLDKVFDAQTVLKSIIRETNVVKTYGIAPDCDLYLKPENLQITGCLLYTSDAADEL